MKTNKAREMWVYGLGGTKAVKHSAGAGRAPAGCEKSPMKLENLHRTYGSESKAKLQRSRENGQERWCFSAGFHPQSRAAISMEADAIVVGESPSSTG
jgi:hypothetical protein